MATPVLNSAAELYKGLKERGLHLRPKNGRDNQLLEELAKRLGCPDKALQKYLNKSAITAETLLLEFLKLTQPFAKMFEEIWNYLATKVAPVANESISIRFGFPETKDPTVINLEVFRRYVESSKFIYQNIVTETWNNDALGSLFELSSILTDAEDFREPAYKRYRPGEVYDLPIIEHLSHPIDYQVLKIRNLFQKIIQDYNQAETERTTDRRSIQELNENTETRDNYEGLRDNAFLLTDLLPRWHIVFNHLTDILKERKDEANDFYERKTASLLSEQEKKIKIYLKEALDILDLPFWKHRWHTYEIWSTILTINTLLEYHPVPIVKDGRIPFDDAAAALIAHLTTQAFPDACLAIQVQTPFDGEGNRRAIRPDLRICYSSNFYDITQTAGIIEFKQRESASVKHIEEVSRAYSGGAPNSGGLLIINYDEPAINPHLAPNSYFIQGVQPNNYVAIQTFKKNLFHILQSANYLPVNKTWVVLLDVSGSMGSAYQSGDVQTALSALMGNSLLKVYRFNDGLVEGGNLTSPASLSIYGGTELTTAINQLMTILKEIDQLLIVTDGGHEHPDFKQWNIGDVKECEPKELGKLLNWFSTNKY